MRKSIVVLSLAALFSALSAGCMPNGEGFAFSPRSYAYFPTTGPGPSAAIPTTATASTGK